MHVWRYLVEFFCSFLSSREKRFHCNCAKEPLKSVSGYNLTIYVWFRFFQNFQALTLCEHELFTRWLSILNSIFLVTVSLFWCSCDIFLVNVFFTFSLFQSQFVNQCLKKLNIINIVLADWQNNFICYNTSSCIILQSLLEHT